MRYSLALALTCLMGGPYSPQYLAHTFVSDFASDKSVADVLRHFDPSCPGTEAEQDDVAFNRQTRTMTAVSIQHVRTFDGPICPFRDRQADACTIWRVEFRSRLKETGALDIARGLAHVTAVKRNGHWRLCDSDWENAVSVEELDHLVRSYRR